MRWSNTISESVVWVYGHLIATNFGSMLVSKKSLRECEGAHARRLNHHLFRTHRLAIARRMGAERMRRLMEMVKGGRVDLTPLLMHRVSLNDIKEGYRIFGDRLENVLKVAVRPE